MKFNHTSPLLLIALFFTNASSIFAFASKTISQPEPDSLFNSNYKIHSLYSNTPFSEYLTNVDKEHLFLITNRSIPKANKRTDKLTKLDFNTLVSYRLSDGQTELVLPSKLEGIQIGSHTLTKDGNTLYVTVNLFRKKLPKNLNQSSLKIVRYTKVDGNWGNPELLDFNSNDYNCAHPVLDNKEEYLYFSSDMPGGRGQSDLYKVKIEGNKLSRPINLGATINTRSKESFPHFDQNGTLYFASDRAEGLGGLDVYAVNLVDNSAPVNIGAPINSRSDDFGFIPVDAHKGYFTSNRSITELDDIYSYYYSGRKEIMTVKELEIKKLKEQKIALEENSKDLRNKIKAIEIQRAGTPLTPENKQSLADKLKAFIIYFDFDSAVLTAKSKKTLDELIDLMYEYKNLKVQVIGYTDQKGNKQYNLWLSQKRSKSTIDYVVNNGHFAMNRFDVSSLGKENPVLDCESCPNDQNLINRRVEFRIIP